MSCIICILFAGKIKMNSKMVELNPTISVLPLYVNSINILIKRRVYQIGF
jgi:hypothetical protein